MSITFADTYKSMGKRYSMPVHVGRRIEALRKRAGMTQIQLSQLSGVGQSMISSLEQGKIKQPGAEVILRLADALKTSGAYLLWDYDSPTGADQYTADLRAIWDTLDDASRATILAYAKGVRDAKPKTMEPEAPRRPVRLEKDTH